MRPGRLTIGSGISGGYTRPFDCDRRALGGNISASNGHTCAYGNAKHDRHSGPADSHTGANGHAKPNRHSGPADSHTGADGHAKPNRHSGPADPHTGADGHAEPNGDSGPHAHEH